MSSATSATRSVAHASKAAGKKVSAGDKHDAPKSASLSADQQIIANIINDFTTKDIDIEDKVNQVMEATKATKDDAIVALHDCDYDLTSAVTKILEGDADDSGWTTISKRDRKDKNVKSPESRHTNGVSKPGAKGPRNRPDGFKSTRQEDKPARDNQRRGKRDENSNVAEGEVNEDSRGPRPPRRENRQRPDNDAVHSNRGKFNNRGRGGRGTRTFLNQQRSNVVVGAPPTSIAPPVVAPVPSDDFPNSIDTWSNATVDPNARPTPVPITSMTVGNWSDVVSGAHDDMSEEDYEANLKETKVFVASRNVGEDLNQKGHDGSIPTKINEQIRGKEAGAQLLQSLKGQPPQQVPPPQQPAQQFLSQSYINKQTADSIKSLVGISPATRSPPRGVQDMSKVQQQNPRMPQQQQQQPQQRRTMRIPESAVEMPVSNQMSALGVQFGALDVNFGSESSAFKTGTEMSFQQKNPLIGSHPSTAQQLAGQSSNQVVPSLLSSAPSATFDQQSKVPSADAIRPTSDMMKNLVSSKQEASHSDAQRGSSQRMSSNKASMDPVKSSDAYSSHSDAYKGQGSSYGGQNYGSSGGFSAASYAMYQQQPQNTSYANYSGYSTNIPSGKPSMKDLDSTPTASNRQTFQDLVVTQTTNVLKNSLTATGKGVPGSQGNAGNTNMPSNVPLMTSGMMPPQFIMSPGMPGYYPAGFFPDPSLHMQPTPSGQDAGQFGRNAPYNQPGSDVNKFSRGPETSETGPSTASGPSVSQAHAQPSYIHPALPPGYAMYFAPYHPQNAPGMFPPQGSIPVPVPPGPSGGYPSGPSSYPRNSGYNSYQQSGYDASGLSLPSEYGTKQGPYAQQSNLNQGSGASNKNIAGSGSDLIGSTQSSHGKPHSAGMKMNYGASNPSSYNFTGGQTGGSYGNSYMTNPQGFQDVNQAARTGQGMGQGVKPSNTKPYGPNLSYGQQPW